MSNLIEYKGFYAKIEYSSEDNILFGKVQDVTDSIIFEIDDPKKTNDIFHQVIDDYLQMCEEIGKEPCKSFSGSFNVRISPELHRAAVQKSRVMGISLNSYVENAIEKLVYPKENVSSLSLNVYFSNVPKQTYESWWKESKLRFNNGNMLKRAFEC